MNKLSKSIKGLILVPVFILGFLAIFTCGTAQMNLKNVNGNATDIADVKMKAISDLGSIQSDAQEIHKLALSHIVATQYNTMISIVDSIQEKEAQLDKNLTTFKKGATKESQKNIEELEENYQNFKLALNNLLAFSANLKSEAAYETANGDLASFGEAMEKNITSLINETTKEAEQSRKELSTVYKTAMIGSVVVTIICVFAIFGAVYIVTRKVVSPITKAKNEISEIISDIDARQGDLTKRVTVVSDNEIAQLALGINAFLKKLQDILGLITDNSLKMETVVEEVLDSVQTSNDSATDLSALTEELSATMQEVSNNTAVINRNVDAVRDEVSSIAQRTVEINEYSKNMKSNADEMEHTASANMDTTNQKVKEISDVLNQAIINSKSVDQVNNLTNDILSISSQTNLLALNASIEAARAGEAGRGFAVVAEEISQLAASSRETANHIQEINAVVTEAVHNLADNSNMLITYLNEDILPEFASIVDMGGQYKNDSTYIEDVMNEFAGKTEELNNVISEIATSINYITSAIEDGVDGVTGAAESTQNLVVDMENITNRMNENKEIAAELKKETDVFVEL